MNFRQHVFGPRFDFKLRQFTRGMIDDAHLLVHGVQHLEHPCHFVLRQQPDLQVQIRAALCFVASRLCCAASSDAWS